ncbi:YbaB/EbfC family nucleoid-associated protein [Hymenobacter sp. ASUV-10]|jgi:DNA-binding YbaB/EbfC family protein|uniref:Nucleoid-associated protein Q5H93_23380 n=1 Tax=Hymenobacter aranciens TaxID=3063996 RepID=A0ABT9BHF3_9BACT|nr:YbaB/EbfC family nucleoid-associated protein [Hymenobacter sp. ASUV-10]MDO7877698.1 YbaB/EbfC family nucleoid-associated protein [Hymenobacter sp. ASUV-10]
MAFDITGMMGKMKDLQDKMQQAQQELQHITATGEAGGGLVKATANGHRQLIKLDIDESLLTPQDRDMVADLVVAAVNKALDTVAEQAKQEMQRKTSGMLPNIPGLDLSGFGA